MKSFKSIPGPRSWPVLGTLPYYYGPLKKYDFNRLHRNGALKYKEFGPLVREEIVPGVNILWIFDPDDIKTMFRSDGKYPARRSHLALNKYRRDKHEIYSSGGLLPTNGPKWKELRSDVQKAINLSESVDKYLPDFLQIASEFSNTILKENQENFVQRLQEYFLEITGILALDTRLGSLACVPGSIPDKLIKSAFNTNSNVLKTDNGLHLWKYIDTSEYKTIKKNQTFVEKIIMSYLNDSNKRTNSRESSALEKWLRTANPKDAMTIISDLFLAGIDTSSYASGFLLYHLAKNQEKQDILRTHIKNDLNSFRDLKNYKYGKAVLKESLRLNPVSVGIGRVLESQTEFSGFTVPSGTVLVSQNQVSCRFSSYFENPDDFIPERWLDKSIKTHPFLALPFGFGPRSCVGRKIAEVSINILIINLISKFRISLIDSEKTVDCFSYLINAPDQPIDLIFSRIK